MREYRHDVDIEWAKAVTPHLPTVRRELRTIDDVAVDGKHYQQWSIRELDDGVARIDAWHDKQGGGGLIAIQLQSRAEPDTFRRKASEAYGAPPQNAKFQFFDDRTKMKEAREVFFWTGKDMTAFTWTTAAYSPILLLWSNQALAARELEYRAEIEAPGTTARDAARTSEMGTKF